MEGLKRGVGRWEDEVKVRLREEESQRVWPRGQKVRPERRVGKEESVGKETKQINNKQYKVTSSELQSSFIPIVKLGPPNPYPFPYLMHRAEFRTHQCKGPLVGRNRLCRSPGDKGILGLQGQGSGCGLDIASRGHSQAGPYRTLPGRLRRQRGESGVTSTSITQPRFLAMFTRFPPSPKAGSRS